MEVRPEPWPSDRPSDSKAHLSTICTELPNAIKKKKFNRTGTKNVILAEKG